MFGVNNMRRAKLIFTLLLSSLLSFKGVSLLNNREVIKTSAISKGTLVISEVYGGGSTTSPYNSDYIEIYNNSDTIIDVSDVYVHYGAARLDLSAKTRLSGHILPRSYYLIKEAGVSGGNALPTPDTSGSIQMASGYFKVALSTSELKPDGPDSENVLDFLGTGTANAYEGSPAPAGSNELAVKRTIVDGVASDSDDNSVDFTTSAPNPKNSAISVALTIMNEDTAHQCITKYPFVKNLLANLSPSQLDYFKTNDATLLNNARIRLYAWSVYHNDETPYPSNDLGSDVGPSDNRDQSIVAIIIIGVLSLTTILGLYFINKKKDK